MLSDIDHHIVNVNATLSYWYAYLVPY